MSAEPSVLVIGSGPAGVSAAWALLEEGIRVQLVDPGVERAGPSALLDDRSFAAWRATGSEQVRLFLGSDAALLENASPKLRAPEFAHVFRGFRERYRIAADGFSAHGSLAPGGLSNAWGTGVGTFTAEELVDYPVRREELLPSYRRVAERIGVSGSCDDELAAWFGTGYALQEPNPLEPRIAPLAARYAARVRRQGPSRTFRLGRPQQAVLTADLGPRLGCNRCAMCIYGCRRGSIYSAADELPALVRHPGFAYAPGWFVDAIRRDGAGFRVDAVATASSERRTFRADRVVLAAGTLGSTRLALDLLGAVGVDCPLVTTPVMTFALLLPRNLRAEPPERGYALGQLAFVLRLAGVTGEPEIFGGILPTTGMLTAEIVGRLPLLRPFARELGVWLWPRILIGTSFFPGSYSQNTVRLERAVDGDRLAVRGGYVPQLASARAAAVRALRREFAHLGAVLLPGATATSRPGEEMHYAGTLPMRDRPGPLETDREGRLTGADGVYIVDGAVLPSLPAKSHTLTIMANADRIARAVAAALHSRSSSEGTGSWHSSIC